MFGDPAPGSEPVLGVVVIGDAGGGVGLDAAGGAGCTPGGPAMPAGPETPAAPRSRLRSRSLTVGAAPPGAGPGLATAGPPRLWSQAVNSGREIVPFLFASTDSNGVSECAPSFHSSVDTTPFLSLSIARNRSAGVMPMTLAPPRAELHSRNSLSEILPSPFRSTTVNGTGGAL